MKKTLIRMHWIFSDIGIDFLKLFKSIKGLPIFMLDFIKYKKNFSGKIYLKPCLNDRYENAGDAQSEYFLQDLFIARLIFKENPIKHIDIGSRIDGFIAHIASFREIEVLDVRPLKNNIQGIKFTQIDLMNNASLSNLINSYVSLSCLHTIEHFGLGRYGDPINPNGYIDGIKNMSTLLKKGGKFYLSTPIGKECVEFNANRIFNPIKLLQLLNNSNLRLINLYILSNGDFLEIEINDLVLSKLAEARYNLGIFILEKV